MREVTGHNGDWVAVKPTTELEWMMMGGDKPRQLDERTKIIQRAVESLDERSRLVLEGIFYEGLSYSQLAERYNYSHKPFVWRLVKNALAELKEKLSNDDNFAGFFTDDMA